jgi:hypothetical protein
VKKFQLKQFSGDNHHNLIDAGHEAGHLRQMLFSRDSTVQSFYWELDADMHSYTLPRKVKIGEDSIKAKIHARNMHMLMAAPICWYAASLEALEAGQKPRDFFDTYAAVMEIRLRLAMHKNGSFFQQVSSANLQDSICMWRNHPSHYYGAGSLQPDFLESQYESFCAEVNAVRGKNPASIYTGLRQLVEQKVFTDPFAEKLAVRILEAVSYFNADLIYDDRDANHRRIEVQYRPQAQPRGYRYT